MRLVRSLSLLMVGLAPASILQGCSSSGSSNHANSGGTQGMQGGSSNAGASFSNAGTTAASGGTVTTGGTTSIGTAGFTSTGGDGAGGTGGDDAAGAGGQGGTAPIEPEFFNLPFSPSNLPDTIGQVQVPINNLDRITNGGITGTFGSYGLSNIYECVEEDDTNCIFGPPSPKTSDDYSVRVFTQAAANAPEILAIFVRSLAVPRGEFSINSDRPVVIVSQGPISVAGTIRVIANNTVSPTATGAGSDAEGGAGGGAFCGGGGNGADNFPFLGTGGLGGSLYGTAELIPLLGGSPGGISDLFTPGGKGGRALQLVSGESITVTLTGRIVADGDWGEDNGVSGGGGGASGGAILLEAPIVEINGEVSAKGGLGGIGSTDHGVDTGDGVTGGTGEEAGEGGSGGSGWIRINTIAGDFAPGASAIVAPATTTTCFSTGVLRDAAAQVADGTIPPSCADQFADVGTPCTTCVQTNCCDEMDACFDEALGCADDLRSYYQCPGTCVAFKGCVATDCEGCLDVGN